MVFAVWGVARLATSARLAPASPARLRAINRRSGAEVLQFTMVLTFVTIFTFVYFNSDMRPA